MGGPIGVTSGKFILIGAALLVHGRVNGDSARIDIEPGAPTSAIGPVLAKRVETRDRGSRLTVLLRSISFNARIATVAPDLPQNADLRIGQDLLKGYVIAVDFARHELQALTQGDAHHLERLSTPIPIRRQPDGSLSVDAAIGGGAAAPATLDLSSDRAFASPDAAPGGTLKLAGVDLGQVDVSPSARPIVGPAAFGHRQILFDLGHDRIWVRR